MELKNGEIFTSGAKSPGLFFKNDNQSFGLDEGGELITFTKRYCITGALAKDVFDNVMLWTALDLDTFEEIEVKDAEFVHIFEPTESQRLSIIPYIA